MYNASSAFHTAVANGAHQIALLIFSDAVFTNKDINVTSGIEFNDYFNTEEDLTIGQALSNEISFSLFNDTGLLDNYGFGEFTATIGAQIGNETVSNAGTVQAQSASHTYVAYASSPYLKRDGSAVSSQPAYPVKTILIYDGIVYCRLSNGAVIGYKDSNGTTQSVSVNNFMKAQLAAWEGEGIAYTKASGENYKLRIWKGTNKRTYEFVPLGVFNAERPNVPYVNEIRMTCYDRMQRFETDMPNDEDLEISYDGGGCTFSNLFTQMCSYLEVPFVSSTFINSAAKYTTRPEAFDNATMRDVLQWIAEAAGSVARFDRDGRLKLDWLRTNNGSALQTIDEHGYSDFNPYWYATKQVTELRNRAADGSYENSKGNGNETYLIQDNPLLKGVTGT